MKRFEIVGTTADAAIIAYGKGLEGLFESAAWGMFSLIFGAKPRSLLAEETKTFTLTAIDAESLLVSWLSELLWHFDARSIVATSYDLVVRGAIGTDPLASVGQGQELSRASLEARVGFVRLSECGLLPTTDVKAVTMHGLAITSEGGMLRAKVIFDI